MASGLPVVVSRVNGFIAHSYEDFVEKLRRLLESPRLREFMSAEALRYTQSMDLTETYLDVEHVVVIPGKKPRTYTVGRTRFYELSSFGLIGGYRFFSFVKEINRIIEEEKLDVVELGGTYLLVPFLKRKNYLLSVFYHADAKREIELMPMPSPFKKMLLNHVFERCLKKADLLLVPTEKYKREFDALGFENVYYAPMGVDTELFNPSKRDFYLKKTLGSGREEIFTPICGQAERRKGHKNPPASL